MRDTGFDLTKLRWFVCAADGRFHIGNCCAESWGSVEKNAVVHREWNKWVHSVSFESWNHVHVGHLKINLQFRKVKKPGFWAEIGDIFISFISTSRRPRFDQFRVQHVDPQVDPKICKFCGSDTMAFLCHAFQGEKTQKNMLCQHGWFFSRWFGPVQPRSVRSVPDSLLSQVRIDFVMPENSDLYSMSYNIPSSTQ